MTKAEAAVSASVYLAMASLLEQDDALQSAHMAWAALSPEEREEAEGLWEEAERLLRLLDKEEMD